MIVVVVGGGLNKPICPNYAQGEEEQGHPGTVVLYTTSGQGGHESEP